MSKKWYGSINNRIEEGHNYNKDKLIHVGDDITMYLWSDRHCYFVTRVVDQKHIFVKKYEICANQEGEGGMGHQDWMYFKSVKECNEYLKKYGKGHKGEIFEYTEDEWVFRYNSWKQVSRFTKDKWDKCLQEAKEKFPYNLNQQKSFARYLFALGDEDFQKVMDGKEVVKYHPLSGKVSFGVRDYYFDWEF